MSNAESTVDLTVGPAKLFATGSATLTILAAATLLFALILSREQQRLEHQQLNRSLDIGFCVASLRADPTFKHTMTLQNIEAMCPWVTPAAACKCWWFW